MFKRSIIIILTIGFLACPAQASAAAYGAPAAAGPLAALSSLIDRLETLLPLPAQTKALAHLRLAESKIQEIKKAKAKDAKELLRDYRREMKEARRLAKRASGDAAVRVNEAGSKHVLVFEGLLNKVPDQAKDAIRRAMDVSRRGIERSTTAREKERGHAAKGQGKGLKKANKNRGPKPPKL